MKKFTPNSITNLKENQIFVFGSNLAGRHGAGAAKFAKLKFKAIYGQGIGLQGRCYAIPTKDASRRLKILSLAAIEKHVKTFIEFAKENPQKEFLVTKIGCGLSNYEEEDIAPLFSDAIDVENILLPKEFFTIITV